MFADRLAMPPKERKAMLKVPFHVICNYILTSAARFGFMDIFKYCWNKMVLLGKECCFRGSWKWRPRNGIVRLLLTYPKVDATAEDNEAICIASTNNHTHVLKLLLSIPGGDPAARDNQPIQNSSENGDCELVEILLRIEGVDATASNNYSLRLVAMKGHLDVVKMLLEVDGVDASAMETML
ncbi:hypothetical protein HDU76_011290 [Blyttiomyces sp. JEL0837]|nr:hypothetical protein HDU76_011290 [Blyttiomyces sp. JEL0837]